MKSQKPCEQYPFTHSVRGIVRRGNQLGRTLGYPTANQILHRDIADGVYVSTVFVRGQWKPSMTFIGAAETFGGTKRKIETFIFDFRSVIYGEWITVRLHARVRGSKKFTSAEALIEAMHADEAAARKYFS